MNKVCVGGQHCTVASATAFGAGNVAELNGPRNTRIRIPVGDHAEFHVRHTRGLSIFCLIQCVPFFLAWMTSVADFCLTLSFCGKDATNITVAFHDGWYYEAILLVLEAGFAMLLMCTCGGIIASRFKVSPTYHIFTCTSICALIGSNFGWMIHEYYRGHTPVFKFWKISETKNLLADLKSSLAIHDVKIVPSWMISMQANVHCCGVKSFEDWEYYFNFNSLPDSCCQNPEEGCGNNYFKKDESNKPTIFETGCAVKTFSGMNYKAFYLLLLLKAIETFLFILALLVWLCCFRKEHLELQIRRQRRQISNQHPNMPPSAASTDPNNNVLQACKIFYTVTPTLPDQDIIKKATKNSHLKRLKGCEASDWNPLNPITPTVPQLV